MKRTYQPKVRRRARRHGFRNRMATRGGARPHPAPPAQGKEAAVGLIGRVHGRERFGAFGRAAPRGRADLVSVRYSPAADVAVPCLAYATPRRLGPAVVRNRIRRRLRAVFRELAEDRSVPLPPGDYLVMPTAGVATATYSELRLQCRRALEDLARRRLDVGGVR